MQAVLQSGQHTSVGRVTHRVLRACAKLLMFSDAFHCEILAGEHKQIALFSQEIANVEQERRCDDAIPIVLLSQPDSAQHHQSIIYDFSLLHRSTPQLNASGTFLNSILSVSPLSQIQLEQEI